MSFAQFQGAADIQTDLQDLFLAQRPLAQDVVQGRKQFHPDKDIVTDPVRFPNQLIILNADDMRGALQLLQQIDFGNILARDIIIIALAPSNIVTFRHQCNSFRLGSRN